ncbi:hypothetical protein BGZ76_005269 [Entomortierella beljakovae]|nr:hypothetical protein BGZ76_005269 [Entomortierella beljakovae]
MEKSEGMEHVSLENFVNKFEFSHQESATDAYQRLISYHSIRESRKQRLQEAFENFRQRHEERFWAKLEVTVNSEVVANHKYGIWESMCDAMKDSIQPLSEDVSMEGLKWLHKMANNKMESFEQMMEASPPSNPNLKSALRNIASNTQCWSTQARNENQ